MDGPFQDHSDSWQNRWSGVANRLEVALENRVYRNGLCCATILFVVGYACLAARLAEPPRWLSSRLIQIDDSINYTMPDIDRINRALSRVEKLASVLALKPQRLLLRPTRTMISETFGIERHILRLWVDEARGFHPGGIFEVASESIVNSIIAIVFEDSSMRSDPQNKWYETVKSFRESCGQTSAGICSVLGTSETANPMSLIPWITKQILIESSMLSLGQKIYFLRNLITNSKNSQLVALEGADRWPTDSRKFGPILKHIVSSLAPNQARILNFKAAVTSIQLDLDDTGKMSTKEKLAGLDVDLLIVTSCRIPRLANFVGLEAKELVWARQCEKSLSGLMSLAPATSAEEFARLNPDVVFVQIGVREMKYAIDRGWVHSSTDISDFKVNSGSNRSRLVAYQIRPQSEEWNAKTQAFRIKAPIEVLKMMRLRSI